MIVERQTQIETLASLARVLADGGHGSALITGPSATGKTQVLLQFTKFADEADCRVLMATGSLSERDLPLAVIEQLLTGLPEETEHGQLRDLIEECRNDVRRRTPGEHAGYCDVSSAGMHRIWSAFASAAVQTPIALVIDDLHLADMASRHVILYIAKRLNTARVALVATSIERPTSSDANRLIDVGLLRQPHFVSVRVRPLSVEAVTEVVAKSGIGELAARKHAALWHRYSGGNPLLLRALIEDTEAQQPLGGEPDLSPAVGEEFAAAALGCIYRSGPPFVELARGLAVIDSPVDIDLLAHMIDASPAAAAKLLETLENTGLLEAGRFRHSSARDILLEEMGATVRNRLYRRAAEFLYQNAESPVRVARYLSRSPTTSDQWVYSTLLQAAQASLAADEFSEAATLAALAEQSAPSTTREFAAVVVRAQATLLRNPAAGLRTMDEVADTVTSSGLDDAGLSMLAHAVVWHGSAELVNALVHTVRRVAEHGDLDDSDDARAVLAWLDTTVIDADVRKSLSDRPADETTWGACAGLTELTQGVDPAVVASRAEAALRSQPISYNSFMSVESALLTLVYAGRNDAAREWCDELIEDVTERGMIALRAFLLSISGMLELRAGHPERAHEQATAALAGMNEQCWGTHLGSPLSTLVRASIALGFDDALPSLPRSTAGRCHTRSLLEYFYARGHWYVAHGHLHAGYDEFVRCGKHMAILGIDHAGFLPWRVDAADALMRIGDFSAAEALLTTQLESPGGDLPSVASRALSMLDGAIRDEDTTVAIGVNSQLRTALSACGDSVPEDISRQRARAAPRQQVLSSAEQRVADHAGMGLTNKQISEQLFVTVSTVEQHLTRVYRKLGVSGRAGLCEWYQLAQLAPHG
ncbi:putative LuxR family transcriptional regulator [Gordonia effusa NBRC 100432]|uniref:Putative LuxR family transcriptional regulator n=1 Tax=Gordonia effusa NBRC 100432 TaxID=1077974 RepID=H0QXL4_9ACTN|nr:helix-turn-helix transcriptional regulator [Gordonia effusa]GAB17565.1 putative LuxR family transcriptional regulator [Gordonia effusa NBRC 100432]